MEKIYNKLVRDNIPEIIKKDRGCVPYTKTLSDEEYKKALGEKIFEEYEEYLNATSKSEKLSELSDMLEILRAFAKMENSDLEEIIEIADEKKIKRGGFERKIFLEKVIEPDE